jgi:hypothetical protein
MALQETYSFVDGNNSIYSFLDSGAVYKCEGGFYSAAQILIDKDNNLRFNSFVSSGTYSDI